MRGGGAEKVFLTMANYFASKNYDVVVLLTKKEGPYLSLLHKEINIVELSGKRVVLDFRELLSYLNKNKVDVFFSAQTHCNVMLAAASIVSNSCAKFIVTEHSHYSINNRNSKIFSHSIVKAIIKKLYSRIHGVVAVSQGVKVDLIKEIKLPPEKIKVIYNPFEINIIKELAKAVVEHKWFIPERNFKTIISVGRYTEAKDFLNLIKAFAILKKKINVRLIILGEGELREELQSLIYKLKLDKYIELYGFVDNPFAYINKADLFVLSSKFEGLPNVLIESMICGVPLVSTDCPSGPSEILENGKWGRLVSVGDPNKLAEAMLLTLEQNNDLDYSIRIKDFDVNAICEQYISYAQ